MRNFKVFTVLPSAKRFAGSGDTKTAYLPCGQFQEANFVLDITAVSGTTHTLNIDILSYDKTSAKWVIIDSFPQQNATGTVLKTVNANLGYRLAISYNVAGTDTPTVTFSLGCVLKG
jgi:hypothetical protein